MTLQQLHHRRSGFTLLEVLLSSALAIVLMAALYTALEIQLNLATAGRDQIEGATLERALVQRVEHDVTLILGPVAPPLSTTTPSTSSGSTTDTGDVITDASAKTDTIAFQSGVVGDSTVLTFFISRATKTDSGQADIRRITYWLTEGGLARQEISFVTSEQVANTQEPVIEADKQASDYVIASEVSQFQVEYWDGGGWVESWDGAEVGPDGVTPKGPPTAILLHIWVKLPSVDEPKEIRHTIAIRAAAGPATEETTTTMME